VTDRREGEVVVRARAALWRTIDDAIVVLGPNADKPRVITGPAAEVWTEAVTPTTLGRLVATLAARHSTPPEVVEADVRSVADLLMSDGALEHPT
jgi:hypothetical protein